MVDYPVRDEWCKQIDDYGLFFLSIGRKKAQKAKTAESRERLEQLEELYCKLPYIDNVLGCMAELACACLYSRKEAVSKQGKTDLFLSTVNGGSLPIECKSNGGPIDYLDTADDDGITLFILAVAPKASGRYGFPFTAVLIRNRHLKELNATVKNKTTSGKGSKGKHFDSHSPALYDCLLRFGLPYDITTSPKVNKDDIPY